MGYFIFGLLIGGFVGTAVMACCIIAGHDDPCRKCEKNYCYGCKYYFEEDGSEENEVD